MLEVYHKMMRNMTVNNDDLFYDRRFNMSVFDNKKNKKSLNIPTKTMGGEYWWETIDQNKNYRLQMHQVSRHCRILTNDNIRIANGTEESMIAEFEKLNRREKAGLGMKQTYPNIKAPTLGGEVFWDELLKQEGYTLQKHKIDGHCRILNKKNIRIAHGKELEMRQIFSDLISGKGDSGYVNTKADHKPRLTLGGKVWWEDKRTEGQYCLQQNVVFGNCRIIDIRNVCIASGNYEQMSRKIDNLIKVNNTIKIPDYGDIIGVCRGYVYDHYGVYENDNSVIEFADGEKDMGNPIIRQTTLSKFIGSSKKCFVLVFPSSYGIPGKIYFSPNVPISERSKSGVFKNIKAFIKSINLDAEKYLDYIDEGMNTFENYHFYTPTETIARAKKYIGKNSFGDTNDSYALHRNNCEHFAIWCKTGLRQSLQAEGGLMRKLRAIDIFNNAE